MTSEPAFCPICGRRLSEREEGGRARPACLNCGYVHYINPIPSVGILIEKDGGIVLIERAHDPHEGSWTLPSGYVEADESAEEAAIREAEEETGLKVKIMELAGVNSFPEGPPVSGIMLFYRARPIGGELRAGDDARSARVFMPEEIPRVPFRTHREMIALWLERRQEWPSTPREVPDNRFVTRPAHPDDVEYVLELLALIPHNRGLSEQALRDVALRIRESASVEVFVAESTQAQPIILGCLVLSVVRGLTEGIGLINDMAVLPSYQRKGVGGELLALAMRRAAQLNLSCLWVNTQRANNQVRAFYANLGFADTEVMQLRLR
jgi:8-oxo-dGTP diphosphatase